MLEWFELGTDVPLDVKRLIAETAWGKGVVHTRNEHWQKARTNKFTDNALNDACLHGHLAVAEWLCARGDACISGAIFKACFGGHLDVAQWLFAEGALKKDVHFGTVLQETSKGGHVHIVRWLHSLMPMDRRDLGIGINVALSHGKLAMAKWFAEQGSFCSKSLNFASKGGNVDAVKWVHSLGATDFNVAMMTACLHGHLAVAKWARAKGAATLKLSMGLACMDGNLHVVKWLVSEGGSMREGFLSAVYWNHASIVKWLKTQGMGASEFADHPNSVEISKYLQEIE